MLSFNCRGDFAPYENFVVYAVSVGDGASTSRFSWNHSHIVHPFCAGATKTATEVCKYTQLEFLDLFTWFCYTVNEDMKGGESDEQGGSN